MKIFATHRDGIRLLSVLQVFCFGVLVIQATTGLAKDPSAIHIDYEVRRLASADRYEITLRFKGDASGRSALTIPTQWGGATDADRGIDALEVLTSGATSRSWRYAANQAHRSSSQ